MKKLIEVDVPDECSSLFVGYWIDGDQYNYPKKEMRCNFRILETESAPVAWLHESTGRVRVSKNDFTLNDQLYCKPLYTSPQLTKQVPESPNPPQQA